VSNVAAQFNFYPPDVFTAFTPPGDQAWRDWAYKLTNFVSSSVTTSSSGSGLAACVVAALPPVVVIGTRGFVTDANTTIILGLGSTPVGGSTNKVPVYFDGTGWLIG